MTLFCAASICALLDRHWDDCEVSQCRGCLPDTAADGSRLCRYHLRYLAKDAIRAAELDAELALVLTGSGAKDRGGRGGTPGLTVNHAALECRNLIRATLVSWCRLIAEERGIGLPARRETRLEPLPPGTQGPRRQVHGPWVTDDTLAGIAAYVARHASWLGSHEAAGEACEELRELAHGKPYRVAYPNGARVVRLGSCPATGCEGEIRAALRRADTLLPSRLSCDVCELTWTPAQWRQLSRALCPEVTPARHYTTLEISLMFGLASGGVYRLASEHKWRRLAGARPTLYDADDVDATFATRVVSVST